MNKFWKIVKKILANYYFNWALLFLIFFTVVYFSFSSGVGLPTKMNPFLHFIEYAVLSLFLFRAFYASKIKYATLLAVIFAIVIGIFDELHQIFVSGRVFQYGDILANSIGAISVQFLGKIRTLFLK
ncbi:VanZ family protein [Candidatus Woesearchaeota archaeon]|nr:VanZ family protein [Candidatus Woesearchaeota archaeon]